jgi:hypothetical protein
MTQDPDFYEQGIEKLFPAYEKFMNFDADCRINYGDDSSAKYEYLL